MVEAEEVNQGEEDGIVKVEDPVPIHREVISVMLVDRGVEIEQLVLPHRGIDGVLVFDRGLEVKQIDCKHIVYYKG